MSEKQLSESKSASAPSLLELPLPEIVTTSKWRISLIWLIPLIAALVGIGLVVNTLRSNGPTITLTFLSAESLEAGKTKVKYKDVEIGLVNTIRLAKDLSHILVTVQLQREAKDFTAEDTRFWVVRPRLDTTGISGLNTLLSGAYIGVDAGISKNKTTQFKGLEHPPIVTRNDSGRQFIMHASDIGSLDVGSPVYFRRVKVGQVTAYDLDEDGKGVALRIFINAPHHKFVTADTRFWQASGVEIELNSAGFKLHTQSLATVILGGIAFQTPDDTSSPEATESTIFALAEDKTTAMKKPDGPSRSLLLYFNQSLRGLTPGSAVDFRGIIIGEVQSIGTEFNRQSREFRMPVLVRIYPERLHVFSKKKNPGQTDIDQVDQLNFLVKRGLRAQLRTGNLLTGQAYVALDFFPKADKLEVDISQNPIQLPTIPGQLTEIQDQVSDIVHKINQVPMLKISDDIQATLQTLNKMLHNAEQISQKLNNDVAPEMLAAMQDARKTLNEVSQTLAQDNPLQQDLRKTLQELSRSAASLRILTDYLERHPESIIRGKTQP